MQQFQSTTIPGTQYLGQQKPFSKSNLFEFSTTAMMASKVKTAREHYGNCEHLHIFE
jgi:hypothetical protein